MDAVEVSAMLPYIVIGVVVAGLVAVINLFLAFKQLTSQNKGERQIEPTALAGVSKALGEISEQLRLINREVGEIHTTARSLDAQMTGMHSRVGAISRDLAGVAARVDGLERRLDKLETKEIRNA